MIYTEPYVKKTNPNKPNSNPNKPNHKKAKINVTNVLTRGYGNYRLPARTQNKPKQTQLFRAIAEGAKQMPFTRGKYPSLLWLHKNTQPSIKISMIKVEFAKGWAPIFEKAGLVSLEDFFNHCSSQIVNKNKKREVVSLTLDNAGSNKQLFMKRFFKPHFKDMLFTIRNFGCLCSQAACEWKNANLLLQKGIETYHPVCYGEQMRFGLEKISFIITEKINGPSLTDFVAVNRQSIDRNKKEKIITAVAKLIRKIHNAEICLPDLYLWHIFIKKNSVPDELSEDDLAVIDLHRMRINVSNRNALIKDLGALDFSLSEKYFDDNIRRFFLNVYTNSAPQGEINALYRKIKSRSRILSNRRRRPEY